MPSPRDYSILNFVGDFEWVPPHSPSEKVRIVRAMKPPVPNEKLSEHVWAPDTVDFTTIVADRNAYKMRGLSSVVALVLLHADGARTKLKTVNILTHGRPGGFAWGGLIHAPIDWKNQPPPVRVDFDGRLIDEAVITSFDTTKPYSVSEDRRNSPRTSVPSADALPTAFAKGARLNIISCNAGTGEGGTESGAAPFLRSMASLFGCTVTGFKNAVGYRVSEDRQKGYSIKLFAYDDHGSPDESTLSSSVGTLISHAHRQRFLHSEDPS